jgi:transposase-like protein
MPAATVRRHPRFARATLVPSKLLPPWLRCPTCDAGMTFLRSILNLVKPEERTYRYRCPDCRHVFEYRRRTRRLRQVS